MNVVRENQSALVSRVNVGQPRFLCLRLYKSNTQLGTGRKNARQKERERSRGEKKSLKIAVIEILILYKLVKRFPANHVTVNELVVVVVVVVVVCSSSSIVIIILIIIITEFPGRMSELMSLL